MKLPNIKVKILYKVIIKRRKFEVKVTSTICRVAIVFSVHGIIYISCSTVFTKMTLRRRCKESDSNLLLLTLKTLRVIIEKLYEVSLLTQKQRPCIADYIRFSPELLKTHRNFVLIASRNVMVSSTLFETKCKRSYLS